MRRDGQLVFFAISRGTWNVHGQRWGVRLRLEAHARYATVANQPL